MTTDQDSQDAPFPASVTASDAAGGPEESAPQPHDPWVRAGLVAVAVLTLGAAALAVVNLDQLVAAALR